MIKFANSQFCVHDQDEALKFYAEVRGREARAETCP